MLKNFKINLSFFVLFFLLFSLTPLGASQQDFDDAQVIIQSIENANPNLPDTAGPQKGSIGELISKLFDNNGQISNWFLGIISGQSDGAIMRWSGSLDGGFIPGSITDDGSSVSISTPLNTDAGIVSSLLSVTSSNKAEILLNDGRHTGSAEVSQRSDGRLSLTPNRGDYNTGIEILNNGNVGIGGNPGNYKLDIFGDINFTGDLYQGGTLVDFAGKFQDAATTGDVYYNSGNVGIGNNNPNYTLDVTGTLNATNIRGDGSAITNVSADTIAANAVGSSEIEDLSIVNADVSNTAAIAGTKISPNFGSQRLVTTDSYAISRPNTTGGWARGLHYYPSGSTSGTELGGMGLLGSNTSPARIYMAFGDDPWTSTDGLSILPNGNIGIGTITPGSKLEVNGNVSATSFAGNGSSLTNLAGDNITDNTVDSSEIENNSITNADIADGTIRNLELANDSVNSAKIINNTVSTLDIADGTILGTDISSNTITESDISDSFIARNSNLLDGIDGASFLRSDVNDVITSTTKITGGLIFEDTTSKGYIPHPKGGSYSGGNNLTGAFKVCLPTHGPADMLSFNLDIFDYSTNESVTMNIAGYAYQTTGNNEWVNPTVSTLTQSAAKDYTVRFGGDGVNNCVWIGELTSTWSYPQVTVRDFQGGYSTDIDAYDDGWRVELVNSFDTVDLTVSNNLPVSDWSKIKNKPTTIDLTPDTIADDGIIQETEIAQNTLDDSEIQDNSLTAVSLAANSVGNSEIQDGSVRTQEITNNTITEIDISDSFVARNSNLIDGIDGPNLLRSDINDTFLGKLSVGNTNNRRAGIYGIYDSTKIGHIWSMGTPYQIPQDGSGFGNLYGFAYKHTNNPTGGTMAGGHQAVWVQNGNPNSAIGTNIWTSGQFIGNGAGITNINGDNITGNTIDSSEIQDGSITGTDIATNTVTNADIADGTVRYQELANNSVGSIKIIDNTITETDISDSFVARDSNLLDGIDSASFVRDNGNETIAGIKTFSSPVVAPEPTSANHLTTKNYVDTLVTQGVSWKAPVPSGSTPAGTYGVCDATKEGWVTYNEDDDIIYLCDATAWISIGSSASVPNATTTTSGKIQLAGDIGGTWNNVTINANAITSAKIAANTVTNADIADGTIRNQELANNSVNTSKIADGSVSSADIANNTISETDISDSFVARDSNLLDGVDGLNYTRKDLTNLGRVGSYSFDSVTDTPAEWASLPVGYSRMVGNTIGTAGGAPLNGYGYFTKIANRDSNGGWSGLWAGYGDGQNYIGRTATNSNFATWDKLWSDNNDGSGSGLDADTLDGISSASFLQAGFSGDQIQDNTVDSSEIQNGTIIGGDIAANTVTFANITDNTIRGAELAPTLSYTDNVGNASFSAITIDHNLSGSDALTADRTHRGLFIDVDSSASGGDTSNEHRIYGINSDVRVTGDSDLVYGGYFNTNTVQSTGTISAQRGVYATATSNGTAPVTNLFGIQSLATDSSVGSSSSVYGMFSKALKDAGSTGTTPTVMGTYSEVEIDAGSITNVYANQSVIDTDGSGVITNGYLFHGDYQGAIPTNNAYGVYIADNVDNYFRGTVSSPEAPTAANHFANKAYVDAVAADADTLDGIDSTGFLRTNALSARATTNGQSVDTVGVGAYYLSSSATDKPTGVVDTSLLSLSYNTAYSSQIAGDWRTNNWYVRSQNNGTWSNWIQLLTEGFSGDFIADDTIDSSELEDNVEFSTVTGIGDLNLRAGTSSDNINFGDGNINRMSFSPIASSLGIGIEPKAGDSLRVAAAIASKSIAPKIELYESDREGVSGNRGYWEIKADDDAFEILSAEYNSDSSFSNIWTNFKLTDYTAFLQGSLGVGVEVPLQKLHVDGSARIDGSLFVDTHEAISSGNRLHTAQHNDDTHYGYFQVRNNSGQRGAYFGWGDGADKVNLALDAANTLDITGGTGDATLLLTADTDNVGEENNPLIKLLQDGGGIDARFGIVGTAGELYTNSKANATFLSADGNSSVPIQLVTNNEARITIRGGGEVGIGTIDATRQLDVRGSGMRIDHASAAYDVWLQGGADTSGNNRNLAMLGTDNDSGDVLYLNYSGEYLGGTVIGGSDVNSLGVGTAQVSGNYGTVETKNGGKGGYGGYSINGRAVFMHNGSTTTGIYNDVDNEWLFHASHNGRTAMYNNGSWKIRTETNGATISGTATAGAFVYSSDERLKTNIKPYTGAKNVIDGINTVTYDWKDASKGSDVGVIAQDIQKVFPEAVKTNSDGYLAVDYAKLVVPLISTVQDQQKQIDQLQKQVELLLK